MSPGEWRPLLPEEVKHLWEQARGENEETNNGEVKGELTSTYQVLALFRLGLVWVMEGGVARYGPLEEWFEEVGLVEWWKKFVEEERGRDRKRKREEELK